MTGNDARTPQEEAGAPAAGLDLSGLSTDQLHELLQSELQRRASAGRYDAGPVPITGRFTRRDGISGWLESLRRRQPLYGRGSITADADTITLQGWQRTWLGVPVERALPIAVGRVRNVARIDKGVYLEIARRGWFSRKVELDPDPQADVAGFFARLPATTTSLSAKRQDLLLFERTLRARCPVAWVTSLLVLLNVTAFVAIVAVSGAIGISPTAYEYGNVPTLVLAGEWWRLATALFVHGNLVHLALNMWALWSIGRLTERLYGHSRYLGAYLLAGVSACIVSIAWDPGRWSIGASGAIFGVFGAFIAYLVRPANQMPRAIMRAHWVPTLLFVAFNLLAGAFQQGVDNAAHVGGLLAGFGLGVALIPLASNAPFTVGWPTRLAALALLVGGTSAALGFSGVLHRQLSLGERFAVDHPWYASGEARNLGAWQRLAGMSAAGVISDAQLADSFRTEVLPFWEEAHARLAKAPPDEAENERDYRAAIAEYAQLRLNAVKAIVDAVSGTESGAQKVAELMKEVATREPRIARLALISQVASSNSGLSRRRPFVMLASPFARAPDCVRSPYSSVIQVAETDSRTDFPYLSDAAACRAQTLFVAGDYHQLEALFVAAGAESDFADKLSMAPLRGGLLQFFEFGPHSIETNLARLIEWRRALPESVLVGPLEAELFSAWAWQARGAGGAREVSPRAWVLYEFRTEMAKAALDAEADSARSRSALWYQAWFDVYIDTDDREELLAKLAEAQTLYPRYSALQRGVIRSLLPRWRGSRGDVLGFIDEQVRKAPEAEWEEQHARLVWMYAEAEGDQSNVIRNVDWGGFQRGFSALLERYPDSDYLLNVFARLACAADAQQDYERLRPRLESRQSATAWTMGTTLAGCDQKFPTQTE